MVFNINQSLSRNLPGKKERKVIENQSFTSFFVDHKFSKSYGELWKRFTFRCFKKLNSICQLVNTRIKLRFNYVPFVSKPVSPVN